MTRHVVLTAIACGTVGAAASAGVFDPAMYNSADPSGYGTLLAELNIADTSYDFPFQAGFSSSGYVNEFNGVEFDRTELVSRVYRVDTQTTFSMNGDSLTLNPGDQVFSYSITLVEQSSNTISSLAEFQVGRLDFGGNGALGMDESVIIGRGFVDTIVNTPVGGDASDLSAVGDLGSSLDFQWPTDSSEQLMNDESITLLMFTRATQIGDGFANFSAPPGQQSLGDPNANGAPALIPIIPAPGAGALAALAVGFASVRRRRGE